MIAGMVYARFDEKSGPIPVLWSPEDLPEKVRDLISLKTINILAGEAGNIPESLAVIPFPSINLKGLVKFLEIKDDTHRGRKIEGSLTLLYDEVNDPIFYKYLENFETIFNTISAKIVALEEVKSEPQQIGEEMVRFNDRVDGMLGELYDAEISTFPSTFPTENELVDYHFKIIVCGDPAVGKTSTILRFTDQAFRKTYMPTMGANLSKKHIKYRGLNIKFVIWDIAGQAKFQERRRDFYKGSQGEILVFDLTDPESFSDLPKWYEDIKTCLKSDPIGLILANKNDLINERKVTREEIEKLSIALNLEYFETSALTGENINEAFYRIAELIYERRHGKEISTMDRMIEPEKPFESYEGDKPFLFVSYAHKDKAVVYPIIKKLHEKGVRIWYDEGIPASTNWLQQIAGTIEKCQAFLVFWSQGAFESKHVQNEMLYADKLNKQFFPIYIEAVTPPGALLMQFGHKQALFKYKMTEETFWKKLTKELDHMTHRKKIGARKKRGKIKRKLLSGRGTKKEKDVTSQQKSM